MALAVVLLTGAGLMLRSLWSLQRVDLGFDPSNVLTLRLSLPQASYKTPEEVVGFYQRLLERVRSTPGVRTAGAVRALPLASTIGDFGLRIEGYVPPPGTGAKGDWEIATDGYLEALGERVVRGRDHRAVGHDRRHARRAHQRGNGPPVLGRPGSDRRAPQDRRRRASGPGSRSSGSWPTSVTTASPAS